MGPAQGTLGQRLQPGLWSSLMALVTPHWPRLAMPHRVGVAGALCSSLPPVQGVCSLQTWLQGRRC